MIGILLSTDTLERPDFEHLPLTLTERLRPCEEHESILFIDFAEHARQGRTTVVVDAESTIVPFDGIDIDESFIQKLKDARTEGIERIVIATNKRPKSEKDFWKLQWWGEQIGVDMIVVPLNRSERKPSPYMLLEVAEHFGISTDSMIMIGDKLTGDVAAANNAEIYSIWVARHGREDLLGDRFRRPVERMFAHFVLNQADVDHPRKVKAEHVLSESPKVVVNEDDREVLRDSPHLPEYIREKGLIAGYGGPNITLSDEKLALLREPAYASLTEPARKVFEILHTPAFEAFMAKHGGTVADVNTYARLALAIVTLGLLLTGHRKAAGVTFNVAQITDLIDGWAARMSDEDQNSPHRKKMGKIEAQIDKVLSTSAGLGLVINGDKSALLFGLQLVREYHRSIQRNNPKYADMDTRATRSSKNSTLFLNIADDASFTSGRNWVSDAVQLGATAAKYYSSWSSPRVWKYRKQQDDRIQEIKLQLLAA